MEVWKDIAEFEGLYQVSNLGRVKSILFRNNITSKPREIIMKFTTRSGYNNLILRKNGTRKSVQVHRLVANAFLPNPENKTQVNHKDRNRKNNNVDNLEWCTIRENVLWSMPLGKSKERCIYFRDNKYVVNAYKCAYRKFNTMEEAIIYRDKVINEKILNTNK